MDPDRHSAHSTWPSEGPDAGAAKEPAYTIENAATDVALIPLPAAEQGGVTVQGKIDAEKRGGVLVLAVAGDSASSSAR